MVRILKNEVSESEKEFFDAWLEESNDHKEEFASIALVWDQMGQAKVPPEPEADSMWVRIHDRINTTIQLQAAAPPIAKPVITSPSLAEQITEVFSGWWGRPARYAFAVVAVGVITLGVYTLNRDVRVKEPAQAAQEVPTAKYRQEIVTTKGERATVSLVDGSIVHLNADSKLRISQSYGTDTREVELDGEGYFAVKSDPAHPFRVLTGSTYTEVKGTEFNVRYRNDFLRVVVAKGVVRLMDPNRKRSVDLHKGELTSYVEAVGFSVPRKVNVKMLTAWRENKLAFTKTPLADVMSEIELAYNVTVIIKNKNAFTHTLTGYFVRDSLDEVLSTIALAMDIKIKRDGQTVTVY
jgi:transmembrane sensor